jgi:hypothetical protein
VLQRVLERLCTTAKTAEHDVAIVTIAPDRFPPARLPTEITSKALVIKSIALVIRFEDDGVLAVHFSKLKRPFSSSTSLSSSGSRFSSDSRSGELEDTVIALSSLLTFAIYCAAASGGGVRISILLLCKSSGNDNIQSIRVS